MVTLAVIVEGHGEVEAVPLLVRRVAAIWRPESVVEGPRPIRVPRGRLLKPGELERAVELGARQVGEDGGILVLLDADEDCPAELGRELLRRCRSARGDRRIRVVLAEAEFEAWLLAAAESIAGRRGIASDITSPGDPEGIRDAKGWLSEHLPAGRSYRERLDQPALTAVFDLEAARRRSRSFEKLCRDVLDLLGS